MTLTNAAGTEKRTVVVDATTKRSAITKARNLWSEVSHAVDASVVSGFDPTWFDVAWAGPNDDEPEQPEYEVNDE